MSKNQYQSTEILKIRIPAFVNKVTGDYITSGLDVCTLAIFRPNGTALPSGPHLGTWDANVHIWTFDVPVLSFVLGEWRVKATSDDSNALPRWWIGNWGDYVDDITLARTQIGTPVGASLAADVAAVKAETVNIAAIKTKTDNLPASPADEVTVAAASAAASAAQTAAEQVVEDLVFVQDGVNIIRKITENRWKVIGTQLVVYGDDNSTIFRTYDLKDALGQPSNTTIFERVPVDEQ